MSSMFLELSYKHSKYVNLCGGDIRSKKFDFLSIINSLDAKEESDGLSSVELLQRKDARDEWAKLTLMEEILGDKNLECFGSERVIEILSSSTGWPIFIGSTIICLLWWWMGFSMMIFKV